MAQQKLYSQTWSLAIALGVGIVIPVAITMRWSLGSPQLLVSSIASILVVALCIGAWRSKGKFRVHSILIAMIIVGVTSATVGRKLKHIQNLHAFVRSVTEQGGRVELRGGSRSTSDGWVLSKGGWVFPEWFHSIHHYFATTEICSVVIPADLVTEQNLKLFSRGDRLWNVEVRLQGSHRDSNALLELCKLANSHGVAVLAERLTSRDVEYLSLAAEEKRLFLTIGSINAYDLQLLRRMQVAWVRIEKLQVQAEDDFATDSLSNVRFLQLQDSNVTPAMLLSWGAKDLQYLSIQDSTAFPQRLDSLQSFSALSSIAINFRDYVITDADVREISQLDGLTRVRLANTSVTDVGLEYLSKMKGLVDLEILGSKCTFEGLQDLCRIVPLQRLNCDIPRRPSDANPPSYELFGEEIRTTILKMNE